MRINCSRFDKVHEISILLYNLKVFLIENPFKCHVFLLKV